MLQHAPLSARQRLHLLADAARRHYATNDDSTPLTTAEIAKLTHTDFLDGIYGRCTSVFYAGQALTRLSLAKGRRTVFTFGPEFIRKYLFSTTAYEFLKVLGFPDERLHLDAVVQCFPQKLVLLAGRADMVQPATWEGVLNLVKEHYPKAVADVERYLPVMQGRSVADIEQDSELDYRFMETLSGQTCYLDDERFMDYTRFLALPEPRSLWQTRLFLYCEMRLNEQFVGSGCTMHEDGTCGEREYLAYNASLEELGEDAVVLDLPLVLPKEVMIKYAHKLQEQQEQQEEEQADDDDDQA